MYIPSLNLNHLTSFKTKLRLTFSSSLDHLLTVKDNIKDFYLQFMPLPDIHNMDRTDSYGL